MTPALATLPPPLRDTASGSLGQALEIATKLGPRGGELATAARAAFLHGMESSLLGLAVFIAAAAVVFGFWAPGRDGRQLKLAQRLSRRPQATS